LLVDFSSPNLVLKQTAFKIAIDKLQFVLLDVETERFQRASVNQTHNDLQLHERLPSYQTELPHEYQLFCGHIDCSVYLRV
jgi:hypothetical protein